VKWIFLLVVILGVLLIGVPEKVQNYPYFMYLNWIEGKNTDKYYELKKRNPIFYGNQLRGEEKVESYHEDYPQLWKFFQVGNLNLPLPIRHPLYKTIPIIKSENLKTANILGLKIKSADNKDLISIYALPSYLPKDFSRGQELFKLPYVRNRIKNFEKEVLWNLIFNHQIEVKNKSIEDMIKDLYVLHVRSEFFPQTAKNYHLMGNKGIVELESQNKDQKIELILDYDGLRIHPSLILSTLTEEAKKLRSKFLKETSVKFTDGSLGRILYKEFKELNFSRQVDQEGMLYLFSAWSQDTNQIELLKEMIFYSERGTQNAEQIKVFYEYAFKKYGKTFTTRNIFHDTDDPNLVLQRKIELESIEKTKDLDRMEIQINGQEPPQSPAEKMKRELRKAKEMGPESKEDELRVY
jgi:hypothetical protein